MKTFAVYSIKGGVGKTATAVNLAYLSAQDGFRTLLWDLDPQGAATFTFRIRPEVHGGARALLAEDADPDAWIRGSDFEGLDVLPADFSYRNLDRRLDDVPGKKKRIAHLVEPLARSYDHLFLDCAPSISLVSDNVFTVADVLLVPTIPTPLSLRTLAQLVRHLKHHEPRKRRPLVVPFFNMVDRRKSLHREVCEYARAQELGFLTASIPYSSLVEQMGLRRDPLPHSWPRGRLAQAYRDLWSEVRERVESEHPPAPPSAKSVNRLLDDVRLGKPRGRDGTNNGEDV